MKNIIKTGLISLAFLAINVTAQDWYHDRDERFRGEQWRAHIFEHVREDLNHVGSAAFAAEKERHRLERTKQELGELQGKLQRGRFDNGELSDVIDSLRKSANDDRLSPRDRDVLRDDVSRLEDYRAHHDNWNRH